MSRQVLLHPSEVPRQDLVSPSVNSTLNATTVGSVEPVHLAGILDSVQPVSYNSTAIPRGRMFAECWVVDVGGRPKVCVWRGYLVTSGNVIAGPASSPGLVLQPGDGLRAVVTQTGRGSSNTNIGFMCTVTSVLREGGFIHSEEPGTGAGEIVAVTLSAPAAGQDFARQSVGAKTRLRVNSAQFGSRGGGYTADATAAERAPSFSADDGTDDFAYAYPGVAVTASQNVAVAFGRGLPVANVSPRFVQVALPDVQIPPGGRWQFWAMNRQAGDQWAAGVVVVEEWAVP